MVTRLSLEQESLGSIPSSAALVREICLSWFESKPRSLFQENILSIKLTADYVHLGRLVRHWYNQQIVMKIYIKANPGSRKEYIKKIDATHYTVAVHEPPDSGKANKAIIKSFAKYFDLPPSQINIISGETSKQKIVEIPDN